MCTEEGRLRTIGVALSFKVRSGTVGAGVSGNLRIVGMAFAMFTEVRKMFLDARLAEQDVR